MSSQRGNVNKHGPPKHQNRRAFKNTLHDTSVKTKQIVELDVSGVCGKCKEIVEWKIKYKKYKPLTIPKKCVKCSQKTVKRAYYLMCQNCATSLNLCAKCGERKELVSKHGLDRSEEAHQQSELNYELRNLSERKRRAFFRMQEKGTAMNLTAPNFSESDSEGDEPVSSIDNTDHCADDAECSDIDGESLQQLAAANTSNSATDSTNDVAL